MNQLKPCPNCGSDKIWRVHSTTSKFVWWIECAECHWRGKTRPFEWMAIKVWNGRSRYSEVKTMGMYTGLRFKGVVKKEFRDEFEGIALDGNWEESNDEILRAFGSVSRASFIPCGALAYMPNEWETKPFDEYYNGTPTDGFVRTYNKKTGKWTFQCSLKNYDDTIGEFFKIVPYFIEEIEHAEVFYEEWSHSMRLDIVDGKVEIIDANFIEYYGDYEW